MQHPPTATVPPPLAHLGVPSWSADLQPRQRWCSRRASSSSHHCIFALLCRMKQVNPRVTAGLGPASWLRWSGPELASISAEPFLGLSPGPHSHYGRGTLQRWCSPQAGYQGWRGSRTSLGRASATLVGSGDTAAWVSHPPAQLGRLAIAGVMGAGWLL